MNGKWGLAVLCCLLVLPLARAGEGGIARIDPLPASAPIASTQTEGLFAEREFDSQAAPPTVIGNGDWRLQPAPGIEQPLLLVYHPY
ncbi:MAG TPA: hypothetical protein VET30_01040, partial [Pseudoxanthomonas sp.]|nr:hypothetical protein [Pseudoxanthomonas sp.]